MGEMSLEQKQAYRDLCENKIGYNIKYAEGTFGINRNTKERCLKQKKAKELYRAFTDLYTVFITLEGGQRGGKDVYALWCYANYLMECPDRYHLVTGTTINQALNTVLESDGFGLRFLLPHGRKVKKDNRTVFEFIDWYGQEKEVHFFGGKEAGDKDAFQGISYGSYYANEAILQHIETIREGAARTMASKWRKIIHTQNPLGGSFAYYTEYENGLKCDSVEANRILNYKDEARQISERLKPKFLQEKQDIINAVNKAFLESFNVESIDELKKDEKIYKKYSLTMRNRLFDYKKRWTIESKAEYRLFNPYEENPNRVRNGLYFKYFHFTNKDNLGMTDHDREVIDMSMDKTSITYRRNILGLRSSSDNSIYPTFTPNNIFKEPFPNNTQELRRYLLIDFGVRNDFVILDMTIDNDNTVYIVKEERFEPTKSKTIPTTSFYADLTEKVIDSRNAGRYNGIIVDPSAKIFINELKVRKMLVKKANNAVGTKDRLGSDKKIDKGIFGIYLVREGFSKGKIMIHCSCTTLIDELEGYCFDDKKLELGIEEPIKVADHGCDALRYGVNTEIRKLNRWIGEVYENQKTIYVN